MIKKKWKSVALLTGCSLFLTGCIDNMPDMTQEQQSLVAEYAADLLLKYSANYNNGLTEVVMETEIETETETEEASSEEEETTEIDAVAQSTSSEQETTETSVAEQIPLEQIIGLENMEIQYQDYEVLDSYPNDEENAYFSINVAEGKKILTLYFTISNVGEEDAECDIFTVSPEFYVKTNGGSYKSVMSTLLLDDLATYKEVISAGGESQVVLLMEIDEQDAEEIDTISLRIQCNDQTSEQLLF